MDEIENKKWIITRIDRSFQLYEDFLKKDEEDSRKFIDKEIKKYKNLGKGVLAGMAFFISLALGISQVDESFGSPVGSVAVILFLGIIFYFITIIFEDRNEAILSKIEQTFQLARVNIYGVRGFYEVNSMIIEANKPDDYQKLNYYLSQFIYPSLYLGSFYATKNAMKLRNRIFFNVPTHNKLKQGLLFFKTWLDDAANRYEKEKEGFQNIKLIEPLIGFGNALLDYKKGKETIPKKSL